MDQKEEIMLGNKTIAKLAIAIAEAISLKGQGEVVGPLTRKVLEKLDELDSLEHFANYKPSVRG